MHTVSNMYKHVHTHNRHIKPNTYINYFICARVKHCVTPAARGERSLAWRGCVCFTRERAQSTCPRRVCLSPLSRPHAAALLRRHALLPAPPEVPRLLSLRPLKYLLMSPVSNFSGSPKSRLSVPTGEAVPPPNTILADGIPEKLCRTTFFFRHR